MSGNVSESRFWNWPNRLSLIRIACVPVIIWIFQSESPLSDPLAAAVFTLAAMTDLFDGYLARRNRLVTPAGKVLDPLADKILIAAALILLVGDGRVPVWIAVLLIGRDLLITGLRGVIGLKGREIASSGLGKSKTMLLCVALALLILDQPVFGVDLGKAGMGILWLALVASFWSGWNYVAGPYGFGPWALVRLLRYLVPFGILRRKS